MGESNSNTLGFDALRIANDKRAADWCKGVRPTLAFRMMELAGEAGEACNKAKKLARQEMGWVGGSTDVQALAEELADVVICADLAASHAGIDLGAAVVAKFNATSEKHGFEQRLLSEANAKVEGVPRRAFTVEVLVGGDTWEDAAAELQRVLEHVIEHGPKCGLVSGGVSSGASVNVTHDPAQTHDAYMEAVDRWIAQRDAAKGGGA